MYTQKQEALVESLLSRLDGETRSLYQDVITYLMELGYYPHKERMNISFKHGVHNKLVVKMGTVKDDEQALFFALRFSACKDYPQRFVDVVSSEIEKHPRRVARCMDNGCSNCKGAPESHVYMCMFPDGKLKSHCGVYALEIPDIAAEDVEDIKTLIRQEHEYLLMHEANVLSCRAI